MVGRKLAKIDQVT